MRRWMPSTAALVLLVGACTLDRSGLRPLPDASGAGGGGAGGAGGQGGAPECTTADDCPGEDGGCQPRSCQAGMCETTFAPIGRLCSDDGGEVCDGAGRCVLDIGSACSSGDTCVTGFCADGVCCESACDGACESCDATPGSCTPHPPATDPELECAPGVCDGASGCATGALVRAVDFGGPADQEAESVAVDSADNIVVGGRFQLGIDFGSGELTTNARDVMVAKLGPSGALWSVDFDGNSEAYSYSVAVDKSDNVAVCGHHYGSIDLGQGAVNSAGDRDVFVAKLDATGNLVWSKHWGDGSTQRCAAVAFDPMGNVVVLVEMGGTVNFGGAPLTADGISDAAIAKLDPQGNHLWSRRFGDASAQSADALAIDGQGNIIAFGDYQGSIDFGGGPLVNSGFDNDLYVAKLDPDGNHLASRRFGGSNGIDYALGVAVDENGDIALAGSHVSTIDFGAGPVASNGQDDGFVVKLDGLQLGHLWSRHFGDVNGQAATAVAFDAAGNVIVAGIFRGQANLGGTTFSSAGGLDILFAKYAAGGEHLWSDSFGDLFDDYARALATRSDGSIALTGSFGGQLDFGAGPLEADGLDLFVATFQP